RRRKRRRRRNAPRRRSIRRRRRRSARRNSDAPVGAEGYTGDSGRPVHRERGDPMFRTLIAVAFTIAPLIGLAGALSTYRVVQAPEVDLDRPGAMNALKASNP